MDLQTLKPPSTFSMSSLDKLNKKTDNSIHHHLIGEWIAKASQTSLTHSNTIAFTNLPCVKQMSERPRTIYCKKYYKIIGIPLPSGMLLEHSLHYHPIWCDARYRQWQEAMGITPTIKSKGLSINMFKIIQFGTFIPNLACLVASSICALTLLYSSFWKFTSV